MDESIYYSCNGEHSTNDGANVDKEFKEVLFGLGVLDSDGGELIVEQEDRRWCVGIRDWVLSQLVYIVLIAVGICEEGGDCNQVEVCLEVSWHQAISFLDLFRGEGDSIKRVHEALVCESPSNDLEVLILAERDMIDLVREIEAIALERKAHYDVLESVRWDVEVSWDSIDLEVALDLTSLFLVNFFLHFE